MMFRSPALAALSTAERAASSVAVQQLMSFALCVRSTEYCIESGFIGCYAAINVFRSPCARSTEYCRAGGFIGRCAASRLRAVSAVSSGLSMTSRTNYEAPHCVIFLWLLLNLSLLSTCEWKLSQLTNSSPSLSLCFEWRCTDVVINRGVTNSALDIWLIIRRSCSDWEWGRCKGRAGRSADSNRAKMR